MNYNQKSAKKKQKSLVSKAGKNKRKIGVWCFKSLIVGFLAVVVMGIGAGFGMFRGIIDNAPDIDAIDVQPEGFQTTIYYEDGTEVKTLSRYDSNRVYMKYNEMPKNLVDAFVAIEDERFWTHNGIDMKGIFRAAVSGVKNGFKFDQGASTITQQLIKNNVFNVGLNESGIQKLERKIQEQYLAIELTKKMSKEDTIEYYLNTINLGHGAHGVEAAANTYFGKSISNLTISECAVLAGIPKSPTKYDPIAHPEDNAVRRQIVLDYMLEQGYITQEEYDEAVADNVYERIQFYDEQQSQESDINSYFVDAVIEQVIDDLIAIGYTETQASNAIYTGGLSIYITQDPEIQAICDSVVNNPEYYSGSTEVSLEWLYSVERADGTVENYSHTNILNYYSKIDPNFSLIFGNEDKAKAIVEEYKGIIAQEGDVSLGESMKTTIQPQSSFVLMEQSTGKVLALTGGRGEKTTNRSLNRATQAKRQPGSTFKVLAAFLPAIDTAGKTLATVYDDCVYYYGNNTSGKMVRNWYGSSYLGYSTIRQAIEYSMNIVAVKCLADVTPDVGFDYMKNMGITTLVDSRTGSDGRVYSDRQLATALGGITDGVLNIDITAAYASIANQGVYNKPILYTKVLDHDGNVILENTPTSTRVMKESTAWLITSAMKDVVTGSRGTGGRARLSSGMPVAGKTGTTSNEYDLWFCGYTPYYTASVWMGYDINTELNTVSGHLLMWKTIMDQVIELKQQEVINFPSCSDITSAAICQKSGLLAIDGICDSDPRGSQVRVEYFAKGTVPTETCNHHVKVKICNDTGLPATEFCPDVSARIYIVREEGNEDKATADTPYQLPKKFKDTTCDIHLTPESLNVETDFVLEGDGGEGPFTVVTSIGEGGTVSIGSSSVPRGDSLQFIVIPKDGYQVDKILVNGKEPKAYHDSNSYVVGQVRQNLQITISFIPKQEPTTEEPSISTQEPTTESVSSEVTSTE